MTDRQAFEKIILRAAGLSGQRGDNILFAGLDFEVPGGAALALRGPNGAGKTTLLLTLAGLITPAAGTIEFDGPDSEGPPILHFCGHHNAIKQRLSVFENLEFWAALNGGTGNSVPAALDRVGLGAIASVDAGHLSAGQGKRLALARLLVSHRPVWLLDEPMAALDSAGDQLIGVLLDEHLAAGGVVIAATHDDLPLGDTARGRVLRLGAAS
ncbi:heme ABC exporter ATP-binding protein CcmA [Devosia rhodophyticola]|uniref:Heme ABC exporter ATP-binding protein CcmA n=1 Tax=Devosia rhodophyticola TaxID=3026423 RepID=A0ABY7YT94_9HYPH|nr:heme ABC exporter ATP-binding protein CcmA [Devosia rhodophyticola]WDR04427.1 heme ABC exporter ATP-binding protein CcmA [Devosia rhodophyticola]